MVKPNATSPRPAALSKIVGVFVMSATLFAWPAGGKGDAAADLAFSFRSSRNARSEMTV
jgi:hypothetical protein